MTTEDTAAPLTRKVLFSEALALALGASRVDWGEPDADGFYSPAVYAANPAPAGLDSDDAEPYEPDPGVDPAYDRLLDAARDRPGLDVLRCDFDCDVCRGLNWQDRLRAAEAQQREGAGEGR